MHPFYKQKPPKQLARIGKYKSSIAYVSLKVVGSPNKRFFIKKDGLWHMLDKDEEKDINFEW